MRGKLHKLLMVMCLLLPAVAMLPSLPGCGNQTGSFHILPNTPVGVALDAHTYYDTIVSGVTRARQAGLLSSDDFGKFKVQAHDAYDIILELDKASTTVVDTSAPTWVQITQRYNPAIQKLAEWLVKVQAPASQPVQGFAMALPALLLLLQFAVDNGPRVADWIKRHSEGDPTVEGEIQQALSNAQAASTQGNDEMDKTT